MNINKNQANNKIIEGNINSKVIWYCLWIKKVEIKKG